MMEDYIRLIADYIVAEIGKSSVPFESRVEESSRYLLAEYKELGAELSVSARKQAGEYGEVYAVCYSVDEGYDNLWTDFEYTNGTDRESLIEVLSEIAYSVSVDDIRKALEKEKINKR